MLDVRAQWFSSIQKFNVGVRWFEGLSHGIQRPVISKEFSSSPSTLFANFFKHFPALHLTLFLALGLELGLELGLTPSVRHTRSSTRLPRDLAALNMLVTPRSLPFVSAPGVAS